MRPDLLALLGSFAEQLESIERKELGDATEGTTPEVAELLVTLDRLIFTAGLVRAQVEADLAARMEDDVMTSPSGRPIQREWVRPKLVWDRDYVDRQLKAKIADKVAFDVSTGQVVPAYRHIALEAIGWMQRSYGARDPLSGPGSGLRLLDLDPSDFRRAEGEGRYRIKDTVR